MARIVAVIVLSVGLVMVMVAWPASARGDAEGKTQPAGLSAPAFDRIVLLDPSVPRQRRSREAAQARVAAENGDAYAQYLLGALYRLGARHPAPLFDYHYDTAAAYLSNAAIGGQVTAMAAMAELELGEGKHSAAVLWALLYGHYQRVYETLAQHEGHKGDPYLAYLLQRSLAAFDDPKTIEAAMGVQLRAFLDRHDGKIRDGFLRVIAEPAILRYRDQGRRDYLPSPGISSPDQPGLVMALVGVNSSGRVVKHVVIDALPDAAALRRSIRQVRYEDTGRSGLTWAIAPTVFNSGTVELRR